jgi:hypothetical protein
MAEGRPRSPRQVCAGVPASIDEVACQALFQRDRRRGPPLTTPALLADALAEVIPAPLAPPPAAPPAPRDGGYANTGYATNEMSSGPDTGRQYWNQGDTFPRDGGPRPEPAPSRPPRSRSQGNRPPANRAVIAAVALVVLAAIAVGAWSLSRHPATHGSAGQSSQSARPSGGAAAALLTPVSAHSFNIYGTDSENDQLAPLAIDGNPATDWTTEFYFNNPVFGGLKPGTGLILDMGKAVKLSSVQVTFGSTPGADVAIEVGNSNARATSTLSSFTTVAKATGIGGTYTFHASSSATGRYVLLWITKLPPLAGSGNKFEAEIFNIVVRGSG